MVAGFAVLMGVVPLVVEPVPVSLKCDRAECSWQLGDGATKTFPTAALASARVEPHQQGTRIVIDGHELSIVATGSSVAQAHARAVEQMRAFASGSAPTLALTYPCGGGDPGARYWSVVLGGLLFGATYLWVWLKRRGAAAPASTSPPP